MDLIYRIANRIMAIQAETAATALGVFGAAMVMTMRCKGLLA